MKHFMSFLAGVLFAVYVSHNRNTIKDLEGRLRDKERAEKATSN